LSAGLTGARGKDEGEEGAIGYVTAKLQSRTEKNFFINVLGRSSQRDNAWHGKSRLGEGGSGRLKKADSKRPGGGGGGANRLSYLWSRGRYTQVVAAQSHASTGRSGEK